MGKREGEKKRGQKERRDLSREGVFGVLYGKNKEHSRLIVVEI